MRTTTQCAGLLAGICVGAIVGIPTAGADPTAEQAYLSQLYLYAHPGVTDARLIELGNLTCSVRRSGGTTDDAKVAVWQNLSASDILSSNAEMGTLVHVAIDMLCPEVGYP